MAERDRGDRLEPFSATQVGGLVVDIPFTERGTHFAAG